MFQKYASELCFETASEICFGTVFQKFALEMCFETASEMGFKRVLRNWFVIRVFIFQLEIELRILREKYMYRACIAPRYIPSSLFISCYVDLTGCS